MVMLETEISVPPNCATHAFKQVKHKMVSNVVNTTRNFSNQLIISSVVRDTFQSLPGPQIIDTTYSIKSDTKEWSAELGKV